MCHLIRNLKRSGNCSKRRSQKRAHFGAKGTMYISTLFFCCCKHKASLCYVFGCEHYISLSDRLLRYHNLVATFLDVRKILYKKIIGI